MQFSWNITKSNSSCLANASFPNREFFFVRVLFDHSATVGGKIRQKYRISKIPIKILYNYSIFPIFFVLSFGIFWVTQCA